MVEHKSWLNKQKWLKEMVGVEENGGKELVVEKSCWLKNRVGVVGDGWQQLKVGLITWLTRQ